MGSGLKGQFGEGCGERSTQGKQRKPLAVLSSVQRFRDMLLQSQDSRKRKLNGELT